MEFQEIRELREKFCFTRCSTISTLCSLNFIQSRNFFIHSQPFNSFSPYSGCLPSVFQVFLGYQAGQIILSFPGHRDRTLRYVVWGVVCSLVGLALCGATLNDGLIPINKNLW